MTTNVNHPELLEFDTVPEVVVDIPQTTREHSITGVYALNIPAPEGTTGDWHDVFAWRKGIDRPRVVTLGGSDEVDTNAIYGDFGVYEGRDRVVTKGLRVPADMTEVYVANHFRAILDLLYRSLKRYGRVLNLTGATSDWLDTQQQQLVLEQATKLADVFDTEAEQALVAWIAAERHGVA